MNRMTPNPQVLDMQKFVSDMRGTGECRTVTTRYTNEGMIVTLVLAEEGTLPESYMFEWED